MQNCICPNCGYTLSFPDGHAPAFCSSCGAKIPLPAEAPAPSGTVESLPPAKPAVQPPVYTRTELIGALLSYVAAYCYILLGDGSGPYPYWPVLPVAVFIIALTAALNRSAKPSAESWFWLGCFVISVVCAVFGIGHVWEEYQIILFIHLFAVWWILSRSGILIESDCFDYLPSNALNGFAILPFDNFILRFRTLAGCAKQFRQERGKRRMNWWLIPAALLCAALFYAAVRLLGRADALFENRLSAFSELFRFKNGDKLTEFFFRLLLSIPVGCWLFGLIAGAHRTDPGRTERRKQRMSVFLERLRRISPVFWEAVIVLFSVLYLAFFILQGSYLFGAFSGKLPEGFIVAEYARQGFFELCKIMAVNAVLIWLSTHISNCSGIRERRLRVFCLVLLLESILFAVIAFSKLALYISIYGFTPLRLQSSWLVCVLFTGCVLWIGHLFTGKRLFRVWMIFSAATLTLLMLY